jgi:hypothetical protein
MKISDNHMGILPRGVEGAGLNLTKDTNAAFFVGRNRDNH